MRTEHSSEKVVLASGHFIRFVREKEKGWEYVERHKATGVAVIVAVTDDNKLLLTEQYRPPVGRTVIELPAGLAGDTPGREAENLVMAARRELLEEVGYESAQMDYIADIPSCASLTSQVVSIFRATGLRRVNAGGGDELEDIHVHEIGLPSLKEWLKKRMQEGVHVDAELFAGLYFAGYCF